MDAVTVLRKLLTEHTERLCNDHGADDFTARIDDFDAETLARAILADARFAELRKPVAPSEDRAEVAIFNVRCKLHSNANVYIGEVDAQAAAEIIVREYRRGLAVPQNIMAMREAIGTELGENHPARSLSALIPAVRLLNEDQP